MEMQNSWNTFDTEHVADVPEYRCVYELGNKQGNTQKYGKSDTSCQRRLGEQLGTSDQFRWQASKDPSCDEARLIANYERRFGKLPPGNKQRPRLQKCGTDSQTTGSGLGIGALLVGAAVIGGFLWAGHQAGRRRQYYPRISSGVIRVTKKGSAVSGR